MISFCQPNAATRTTCPHGQALNSHYIQTLGSKSFNTKLGPLTLHRKITDVSMCDAVSCKVGFDQ